MSSNTILKNYDYGTGFYESMKDFKSISEFLKKRKKLKPKKALDFSADNYDFIDPSGSAMPFSGLGFPTIMPDSDGKMQNELNQNNDLEEEDITISKYKDLLSKIKNFHNMFNENDFGNADGVEEDEDLQSKFYHTNEFNYINNIDKREVKNHY